MLLIPESDADSIPDSDFDPREAAEEEGESLARVPASSPVVAGNVVDGEDEVLDGTLTNAPRLNLGRFAFGV